MRKSALSFETPTDIDSQTHIYPSDIDDDSCEFTLPSLPYFSSLLVFHVLETVSAVMESSKFVP